MESYILKATDIKLIEIDEEITLFFHADTLQIYPIVDKRLLDYLRLFSIHGAEDILKYYTQEDHFLMQATISEALTSAPKSTLYVSDKNQPPEYNTVVLPIAADCNLNCPYCFAQTDGGFHFGNFSNEEISKTLAFVVKENKARGKKFFCLIFFGGEPLLNMGAIHFTMDYMKNHYPDFEVFYSITTNGTILNEDIIRLFQDNNIAVLVSIDGPDNEYNLRCYKNGRKSLDKVISNIGKLKENNIRTELRATIVSTNPYIYETFDFLEKLKVPFYVCFSYPSENKSHNLSSYDEKTLRIIRKQFELLVGYYIDKFKNKEDIYNKRLFDYLEALRFRNKTGISCGAGRSYFTIIANGDIYSCPHFMNDSQYCIGNIETYLSDNKKFTAMDISDIKECSDCWIRYFCAGNCLAQKISTGKSNDTASVEESCALEKITFEFYIKLFYFAKKHIPEYFKSQEGEIIPNSPIKI